MKKNLLYIVIVWCLFILAIDICFTVESINKPRIIDIYIPVPIQTQPSTNIVKQTKTPIKTTQSTEVSNSKAKKYNDCTHAVPAPVVAKDVHYRILALKQCQLLLK